MNYLTKTLAHAVQVLAPGIKFRMLPPPDEEQEAAAGGAGAERGAGGATGAGGDGAGGARRAGRPKTAGQEAILPDLVRWLQAHGDVRAVGKVEKVRLIRLLCPSWVPNLAPMDFARPTLLLSLQWLGEERLRALARLHACIAGSDDDVAEKEAFAGVHTRRSLWRSGARRTRGAR